MPSPIQKAPNPERITPTMNFSVFSGTRDIGALSKKPTALTSSSATNAPALAGSNSPAPPAADGDHDEHHLGAFDHADLERRSEGDRVEAPPARAEGQHSVALLGVSRVLVMQGEHAGGAQDRLSEPTQPEQQKKGADDDLQRVKRNEGQRRAEHGGQHSQQTDRRRSASERVAPPTHAAHGEHDRGRLDELDGRGEEGRKRRRGRMAEVDHRPIVEPALPAAQAPARATNIPFVRERSYIGRNIRPAARPGAVIFGIPP